MKKLDTKQKLNEYKNYLKLHPTISANKFITQMRQKDLGMQRQKMLVIYRDILHKPPPSSEKIEKSVPKKYKKVKISESTYSDIWILSLVKQYKISPEAYGTLILKYEKSDLEYFIKYNNISDVKRGQNILRNKYKMGRIIYYKFSEEKPYQIF